MIFFCFVFVCVLPSLRQNSSCGIVTHLSRISRFAVKNQVRWQDFPVPVCHFAVVLSPQVFAKSKRRGGEGSDNQTFPWESRLGFYPMGTNSKHWQRLFWNRLLSARHTKKTVLSLTTLGRKLDLDTNESALMLGKGFPHHRLFYLGHFGLCNCTERRLGLRLNKAKWTKLVMLTAFKESPVIFVVSAMLVI